jgi:hypothetical protein
MGKTFGVSMRILLDSGLKLEPHQIASNMEKEVKSIIPNPRVSIGTEPLEVIERTSGGLLRS